MPLFTRVVTLGISCGFLLNSVCGLRAAEDVAAPIRVLLISGQNNHDWKATTPVIEKILAGPLFRITTTNRFDRMSPSELADYDVLVSNWNNWGEQPEVKTWPGPLRQAFLEFVKKGRGLVNIHAGSSSFYDWREYQQLTGAYWGKETGHGPVHEFEVRVQEGAHPITQGLSGFRITDELWHRTGFEPGNQPIAVAHSAKEKGGSGQDEPVAFVRSAGQGRVFGLLLGHDAAAMRNDGFGALLRRGTEWAATGQVRRTR